jgi:putative addiction module killer protein
MLPIKPARYRIRVYQKSDGEAPYEEWIAGLDSPVRARISARVARFEEGHFGDYKFLGDGVYEARIFIGPGYRIYFALHGGELLLLLTGGDKSTQSRDVRMAKEFFKAYLEVKNADEKS